MIAGIGPEVHVAGHVEIHARRVAHHAVPRDEDNEDPSETLMHVLTDRSSATLEGRGTLALAIPWPWQRGFFFNNDFNVRRMRCTCLIDENIRNPEVSGEPRIEVDVVVVLRKRARVGQSHARVHPVHADGHLDGDDLGDFVHLRRVGTF
jgi:hypothetical protein